MYRSLILKSHTIRRTGCVRGLAVFAGVWLGGRIVLCLRNIESLPFMLLSTTFACRMTQEDIGYKSFDGCFPDCRAIPDNFSLVFYLFAIL